MKRITYQGIQNIVWNRKSLKPVVFLFLLLLYFLLFASDIFQTFNIISFCLSILAISLTYFLIWKLFLKQTIRSVNAITRWSIEPSMFKVHVLINLIPFAKFDNKVCYCSTKWHHGGVVYTYNFEPENVKMLFYLRDISELVIVYDEGTQIGNGSVGCTPYFLNIPYNEIKVFSDTVMEELGFDVIFKNKLDDLNELDELLL